MQPEKGVCSMTASRRGIAQADKVGRSPAALLRFPSSGEEKVMPTSERQAVAAVLPMPGAHPEVFQAGHVVIDTMQTPFALFALAFLNVGAGALLLMHSLAGLAIGTGGAEQYAALAAGGIELVVGLTLWFGARWAYQATRVLIPANLVGSLVLFALYPAPSLLVVALVFGFATFVLYGPGQMARASRIRIGAWTRGPTALGPTERGQREPIAAVAPDHGRLAA
jgi:hypothetical protein